MYKYYSPYLHTPKPSMQVTFYYLRKISFHCICVNECTAVICSSRDY